MLVRENDGQIQLFSLDEFANLQTPRPRRRQVNRRQPAQNRRQPAQRRRQFLEQQQAEIDLRQRVSTQQRIQRQQRFSSRQQRRDLLDRGNRNLPQRSQQLPNRQPKVLLRRLTPADLIQINKQRTFSEDFQYQLAFAFLIKQI